MVYDVLPIATQLTYPIGSERLKPGDAVNVSWDSFGSTAGSFLVQYRIQDNAPWVSIANNLSGSLRQIAWTVPSVATNQARVRVVHSGTGAQSLSEPFTILGVPTASLPALQCEGYINLQWTAVTAPRTMK